MAVCKVRGNEFVILFALTFITLIHCRSLPTLSGTQTTKDEGDKMLSDVSDQAGLDDQISDFAELLDDDTIFALPRSAVETSSDGDETLSDESDQEELDDDMDDDTLSDVSSDGDETLSDESDQEGLDDDMDDDTLSDVSSDGDETLSGSDQEEVDDDMDDDVLSDVSSDGDETLSDESDQEEVDDNVISDVSSDGDETLSDESDQEEVDDDAISAVPRSAVETSSDGEETLSDKSDQEEFDDHIDEDALSGQLESSSEGPWDAMSPKLRCGGDLMNLQLFGSDMDQVELCRGGSAPVPLGHLPPNCGSTSPTHGGLVFATPYDGCGVSQQGGNYVMQLLWQGKPVAISCPMT